MKCKTPNELISHYGKENIVSLVNMRQILSYATWGTQPLLIYESDFDKKLVAYYLQSETEESWKRWRNNKPTT